MIKALLLMYDDFAAFARAFLGVCGFPDKFGLLVALKYSYPAAYSAARSWWDVAGKSLGTRRELDTVPQPPGDCQAIGWFSKLNLLDFLFISDY